MFVSLFQWSWVCCQLSYQFETRLKNVCQSVIDVPISLLLILNEDTNSDLELLGSDLSVAVRVKELPESPPDVVGEQLHQEGVTADAGILGGESM